MILTVTLKNSDPVMTLTAETRDEAAVMSIVGNSQPIAGSFTVLTDGKAELRVERCNAKAAVDGRRQD